MPRRETLSIVVLVLALVGAIGVLALAALALLGCTDRAPRCDVREQIDTTGNTKRCACVCESDDAQQCPMLASDPTRSAIPACWDEGSSST